jgi:hypothetical protein
MICHDEVRLSNLQEELKLLASRTWIKAVNKIFRQIRSESNNNSIFFKFIEKFIIKLGSKSINENQSCQRSNIESARIKHESCMAHQI